MKLNTKKYLLNDILVIVGKKKFTTLLFFTTIISILEVFGTISIYPFLEIASNEEALSTNRYYKKIYEYFNFSDYKSFVVYSGFSIILFFLLSTIISVFINYRIIHETQKVGTETSDKILSYLINSKKMIEFKVNSPTLIRNISQDTMRFSSMTFSYLSLYSKILVLALFFGILAYTNLVITIGSLLFFTLTYVIIYRIVNLRLKYNGHLITIAQKNRIEIITDIVSGIREFTLFNLKDYFIKKFTDESKKFANAYGENSALIYLPKSVIELFLFTTIIISTMYIFTYKNLDIKILIPTIGLYVVIFLRALPAFQQLYANLTNIKSNYSGIIQIKKLVTNLNELNKKYKPKIKTNIKKSINLKNISFGYSEKLVIKNLNLTIKKGDKIAIMGETGAGKSTLINIILGFLKPDKGKYIIDDSIEIWPLRESYQNFTFVPQNIYLMNDTIKKNVVFSQLGKEIDQKKINKVLLISNLNSLVKKNIKGINKKVGERGAFLSGGQIQRLGIARALYSDKDFIIFDESTSSLDINTEKKIINRIFKYYANKTIIFITHKKSFLKNFKKIYHLKNGKLIKSII